MDILRWLWSDPRFRRMVIAVLVAIGGYVIALLSGVPVPTP